MGTLWVGKEREKKVSEQSTDNYESKNCEWPPSKQQLREIKINSFNTVIYVSL